MLIQNYGLHWDWQHGMRGQQSKGDLLVDFSGIQVGIYVLYAGTKPIYVGRSGDGKAPSISGRLVDHERNKTGWNNFCWFGFYPVVDGILQPRKEPSTTVTEAISDIEAFAIYLLKGVAKNVASGKHKHIIEYHQVV